MSGRKSVLPFTFCLFLLFGFYQELRGMEMAEQIKGLATIQGFVSEKEEHGRRQDKLPLNGVAVQLKSGKDSSYVITNNGGKFHFDSIPVGKIELKLQLLGKKNIVGQFYLVEGQNMFYFEMENSSETLEAAKISDKAPVIKQVGDTTLFNTSFLTAMEGESARTLLEQIPGVTVSGGTLTVDGEKIKRTYVNGVMVFGDNPLTAVDALKADEVESIRVYDEVNLETQRRNLDSGPKDKVMDIRTKESLVALSDAIGVTSAGADACGNFRYAGTLAAAFWSEMIEFSVSANAENVPTRIKEEMLSGDPSPINLAKSLMFLGQPINNDSRNVAANVQFSRHWQNRLYGNSVSASYSFFKEKLKTASHAMTEYYAAEDNPAQSYFDSTFMTNSTLRHVMDLSADLNNSPLKSISLKVKASVDRDESNGGNIERITSNAPLRFRNETMSSDGKNHDIEASLTWCDFDLGKFLPSTSLVFSKTKNDDISWAVDTLASSYIRRQLHSDGQRDATSFIASAGLSYALISNESQSLSLGGNYSFSCNDAISSQMTVDSIDVYNPVVDFGNTYDFTYRYYSNSLNAGISYAKNRLEAEAHLSFSDKRVIGDWTLPSDSSTDRHFRSLTGDALIRINKLSFSLMAESDIPSLEQCSERINSSNPLILAAGNPNLKQSYSVKLKCGYSHRFNSITSTLNLSADALAIFSEIVSRSTYFETETTLPLYGGYIAPAGSWLYSYDNAEIPAVRLSGRASFQSLLLGRKLTSVVSFVPSFATRPQYIGTKMETLSDNRVMLILSENFRPSKTLQLRVDPALNYSMYSRQGSTVISENLLYTLNASASVKFLKHWDATVGNVLAWADYLSGCGEDTFTNNLRARINWKLMKDSLTLSLIGGDLLGKASQYTTFASANSYRESWTPSYGRYILFSVSYEFRDKRK